jgi:pimeloyl-ACP methyl ester carboxylesterase
MDRVVEVLDAQAGPMVLVGHSLNGIVISQVAEQRPEKIDKPVYLSASLLPSGKSAIEASQEDTESVILKSVEMDEAQGKITLTEEDRKMPCTTTVRRRTSSAPDA